MCALGYCSDGQWSTLAFFVFNCVRGFVLFGFATQWQRLLVVFALPQQGNGSCVRRLYGNCWKRLSALLCVPLWLHSCSSVYGVYLCVLCVPCAFLSANAKHPMSACGCWLGQVCCCHACSVHICLNRPHSASQCCLGYVLAARACTDTLLVYLALRAL